MTAPHSNPEISRLFRDMADVLAVIETTAADVTVTQASPVADNLLEQETVAVKVGVQIPFLAPELATTETVATLTPTDVRLQQDGVLHVDFQATVSRDDSDGSGETSHSTPAASDARQQVAGQSPDDPAQSQESTGDETHPKPNATSEADTTDELRADLSDSDHMTDATHPAEDSAQQPSDPSDTQSPSGEDNPAEEAAALPAYKDPSKLQAVYEEYETFGEMTDALDVDVTPQTVRRYMIKHGIHEPASTTGSPTAEMLLQTDADRIPTKQKGDQTQANTSPSDDSLSDSPLATDGGSH